MSNKNKDVFDSLEEIANVILNNNEKTTLIHAFNRVGKTRLSMQYKTLVNEENEGVKIKKLLYYNAFTEDLFHWDNDLEKDCDRKLKININSFFISLLRDQGKENEIVKKFKEFTSSRIEPSIDVKTGEVIFNIPTGDQDTKENIKISKAEESVFIWTTFYVLLETIIEELNNDEDERSTDIFNSIRYIFIDDPVSSLDENNIIDIAIELYNLIKKSTNDDLRFIITTHHSLFFNVLYNSVKKGIRKKKAIAYNLQAQETKYVLNKLSIDSPFGYHLLLKDSIQEAIDTNNIQRYHFAFFRNLLEKTSNFLGYEKWSDLIVDEEEITEEQREGYVRVINLYSHNKLAELESKELLLQEKSLLKRLFTNFINHYKWAGKK